MTLTDQRFIDLNHWLQHTLPQPFTLELISGDASFRRYFRVFTEKKNYILADSPPDLVPIQPFLTLAQALAQVGVAAPKIEAFHHAQGFILQQDLGDVSFARHLTADNQVQSYQQALALLPAICQLKQQTSVDLPAFDQAFVLRELTIFIEWFLQRHLGFAEAEIPQQLLTDSFQLLIDNALAQPQVGMHRDFHSRNLMWHEEQLYCIDFQDAVIGPITYDAVSLLRDCYLKLDADFIEQMQRYHYQLLKEKHFSFAQYQRWFDLVGLQRHLKVAGIFCRLHHRDGKSGYLKDIPLTLAYISQITARYQEFSELHHYLEHTVYPRWHASQTRTSQ